MLSIEKNIWATNVNQKKQIRVSYGTHHVKSQIYLPFPFSRKPDTNTQNGEELQNIDKCILKDIQI